MRVKYLLFRYKFQRVKNWMSLLQRILWSQNSILIIIWKLDPNWTPTWGIKISKCCKMHTNGYPIRYMRFTMRCFAILKLSRSQTILELDKLTSISKIWQILNFEFWTVPSEVQFGSNAPMVVRIEIPWPQKKIYQIHPIFDSLKLIPDLYKA